MQPIHPMRVGGILSSISLGLGVVSCGGSSPPAPPPQTMATNPLAFSIPTPTYSVKSGQEIKYSCYTTHLAAGKDINITQIEPAYGKAMHHLGVYYTISDEPEGEFMCPELEKPNWVPLYGGGIQSGTVTTPEGSAFQLKGGQQILIQLHLLNATAEDVSDKATIHFLTTDAANLTPAGIYGMTNTKISIPALAKGEAQMSCAPHEALHAFAVFGHMHELGTHIALSRAATGQMLFGEDWDFNSQPTIPMQFDVAKGESLHLDCQYTNSTSEAVAYGESTSQEMCAFVVYYTPYPHLDGCEQ